MVLEGFMEGTWPWGRGVGTPGSSTQPWDGGVEWPWAGYMVLEGVWIALGVLSAQGMP